MALGSTIFIPYNVCVLDCHNVSECCPQAKNPVHAAWEERLARYSRIAREVLAQGAEFDMGYVRVCAAPLAAAVQKEALAWVASISAVMQKGDCLQLQVRRARHHTSKSHILP